MIAKMPAGGGEEGGKNVIPPPVDTVHVNGDVFGKIAIATMITAVLCFAAAPLLKRWEHPGEVVAEPAAPTPPGGFPVQRQVDYQAKRLNWKPRTKTKKLRTTCVRWFSVLILTFSFSLCVLCVLGGLCADQPSRSAKTPACVTFSASRGAPARNPADQVHAFRQIAPLADDLRHQLAQLLVPHAPRAAVGDTRPYTPGSWPQGNPYRTAW
jgi:hypothetical protein